MTDRIAPGPDGGHLMGALSRFKSNSLGLITDLQQKFGGIVRVRLGPYLVHQLTSPSAVKHVLQDNLNNYRRGRFYQGFTLFMGHGMLTTDGAEWKMRRQLSQPYFQRSRVEAATPIIVDCVTDLLRRWDVAARQGEVVDITDDMTCLSMGVLSRTLFGMDLRERATELLPAVRFSLKAMIITGKLNQMLPRWVPTRYQRALKRSQAALNRVMDDVIAHHRAGHGDPEDLVSALLAAVDPDTGQPWSDRAIRAELKTLFMAGHETTGCGLAWTLYSLAQHDDVRTRLEHELAEVLGGRTPTPQDLPNMPYLRGVVDESLRLHPPIWVFPREAVTDDQIDGYDIPAGSTVLLAPYAAHRNAEAWDSPETFDPGRFCPVSASHNGSAQTTGSAERTRYRYFPFGGGARRCIGYRLALLELQLTVAMVVQRYTLSAAANHPVVPTGLVSLRPSPGVSIRISPREDPS